MMLSTSFFLPIMLMLPAPVKVGFLLIGGLFFTAKVEVHEQPVAIEVQGELLEVAPEDEAEEPGNEE